jgi:hypothetical protein
MDAKLSIAAAMAVLLLSASGTVRADAAAGCAAAIDREQWPQALTYRLSRATLNRSGT